MAFRSGIFTREAAHGRKKSSSGRDAVRNGKKQLDIEYAALMGHKFATKNMNPAAEHPDLPPRGDEPVVAYLLREHPSIHEDTCGDAWSDGIADWLVRSTRCSFIDEIRASYVCPTLPRPGASAKEIPFYAKAYQERLLRDIEDTKPPVIVAFGSSAISAIAPAVAKYGMSAHGNYFPVKVGAHQCLLLPMPDPTKIFQVYSAIEADDGRKHQPELVVWFMNNLRRIETPPAFPELFQPELESKWIDKQVDVVYDFAALKKHFKAMRRSPYYCIDLETDGLYALAEGLGIQTFGFTYVLKGVYHTFVFGWNHPEAEWSTSERAAIDGWIQHALSQKGQGKIAHNTIFELQWLRVHNDPGDNFLFETWECSFMQSHSLGSRTGSHSLDFRCLLYFGLPLKAQSDVDVMKIKSEPLEDVSRYCGLDTYWTIKLWEKQAALIEDAGLSDSYYMKIERLAFLADMHLKGFRIEDDTVRETFNDYTADQKVIYKQLRRHKDIKRYERNHAAMNFLSPHHLLKLIRDTLGFADETSADLAVQQRVAVLHPVMALIIEYRALNKLISTYLRPYLNDSDDTVVYSDGRIHPTFHPNGAATGRLSAERPSVQNIPIRTARGRRLRKAFVPDKPNGLKKKHKHKLLSSDYGQLEARVIGMASRDKVFINALIHDVDVHLEWSLKIAHKFPEVLEITHAGDMKSMRSAIKNQFVFPLFYGSSLYSVARSLGVPPDDLRPLVDEFWREYAGVAKWQKRITRDYRRDGFVRCLTGDLRYGPLDYNQIINTPVQGTASHIVVRAGVRISQMSVETDKPWRKPQINIHDDMVWSIPVYDLEESIDVITKIQVAKQFSFQRNVPLTVGPAVGNTWDEMEEIAEIRSTY